MHALVPRPGRRSRTASPDEELDEDALKQHLQELEEYKRELEERKRLLDEKERIIQEREHELYEHTPKDRMIIKVEQLERELELLGLDLDKRAQGLQIREFDLDKIARTVQNQEQ